MATRSKRLIPRVRKHEIIAETIGDLFQFKMELDPLLRPYPKVSSQRITCERINVKIIIKEAWDGNALM